MAVEPPKSLAITINHHSSSLTIIEPPYIPPFDIHIYSITQNPHPPNIKHGLYGPNDVENPY